MNNLTRFKNTTTVKIVSKIIFVVSCLVADHSFAADTQNASAAAGINPYALSAVSPYDDVCNSQSSYYNQMACERKKRGIVCSSVQSQFNSANNAINKACGNAGISTKTTKLTSKDDAYYDQSTSNDGIQKQSCQDQVAQCNSNMSTGASGSILSNTAAAYLNATGSAYAGIAGALANGSSSSSCPQMSGKTYFNRKDSLEKDIDSTQKELADLNDDKAKAQDDYNKQISDMQDDVNKAQEQLDQTKLDIKDKKRKQLTDFQTQQSQMKDQLRQKSADVLSLRGQLIQSQQDQALKLIAMTDASGKRACMKAVNDANKAYGAISGSTSIAEQKTKKADLIATYNDCMDAFNQQRVALNKSKKQEQDQINQQITNTQQSIDDLNSSLNTASEQLTEMQNDAQTEEDNATQKVVKLMQTTQTKMAAAQQKLQSNLQTIEAKNTSLSQKLNRLNSELSALGPVPPEDSSESASSIGSEITSNQETINDILSDPAQADCLSKAAQKRAQDANGGVN